MRNVDKNLLKNVVKANVPNILRTPDAVSMFNALLFLGAVSSFFLVISTKLVHKIELLPPLDAFPPKSPLPLCCSLSHRSKASLSSNFSTEKVTRKSGKGDSGKGDGKGDGFISLHLFLFPRLFPWALPQARNGVPTRYLEPKWRRLDRNRPLNESHVFQVTIEIFMTAKFQ